MTAATSIKTTRLSLRRPRLEDFAVCRALWSDPAVVRYFHRGPFTQEETWARLLQKIGHWHALGYGYWLLHDREWGRFVGEVGFAELRRDIEPPLDASPEAGWVLASWAHGKGYAFEAMTAALAWLEAHRGSQRTVCIIDPENAPSLRLAARCGYRETGRVAYRGAPAVVLERGLAIDAPSPPPLFTPS